MKYITILLILFSSKCYAQVDFITISKGPAISFKDNVGRQYFGAIKINKKTGDVYYRKNAKKKFKLVEKLKNDSLILYFKDSIQSEKLNAEVKQNNFQAIGKFKVEFIREDNFILFTDIVEFSYLHPASNSEEIEKIIKYYHLLIEKI